jgi:hypothetical protein
MCIFMLSHYLVWKTHSFMHRCGFFHDYLDTTTLMLPTRFPSNSIKFNWMSRKIIYISRNIEIPNSWILKQIISHHFFVTHTHNSVDQISTPTPQLIFDTMKVIEFSNLKIVIKILLHELTTFFHSHVWDSAFISSSTACSMLWINNAW